MRSTSSSIIVAGIVAGLVAGIVAGLGVGAGCSSSDAKDEFMKKGKQSEAEMNLRSIEKSLKTHYVEMAAFPTGSAPLTPSAPCCETATKKCDNNPAQWADDPIWKALRFSVDEPHFYQYVYESNGRTARATAVGDLDCDGTTVTYAVSCEVVDGNPICTQTKPDNRD